MTPYWSYQNPVSAAKEGEERDNDVKKSNSLRWVAVKLKKGGIFWVWTLILGEFERRVGEILGEDGASGLKMDLDGGFGGEKGNEREMGRLAVGN